MKLWIILALLFAGFEITDSTYGQSIFAPPNAPTSPSTLTQGQLREIGIVQHIGSTIPSGLKFTDSTGKSVDFDSLLARKPTLLVLVYYQCPNLCTLVLNGVVSSVADMNRDVGNGFQVVAVSIDPSETIAMAAQKKVTYLRRYSRGSDPNSDWSFLVGDDANITKLADAVGYRYRYDTNIHQYAHGSGAMLLDQKGQIVQYFLGIEYSSLEIEKAVQLAAVGKVAPTTEQFDLLCYCYNPMIGPYGWVIFWVLRLGALGTVFALVTFIVGAVRREQLKAREWS